MGLVYVFGFLIVMAVVVSALLVYGESNRSGAFPRRASELGLTACPNMHFGGTVGGREVIIGYYGGSRGSESRGSGSGVLVLLRVGLESGEHRATLTDPITVRGDGPDRKEFEALLTPQVMAAARGLEQPLLSPSDFLPGSFIDQAIRTVWPGGWQGLTLRTTIPTKSETHEIQAAIDHLSRVSDALHAAADARAR